MSTLQRQPLSSLTTNKLIRSQTDLGNTNIVKLPKITNLLSMQSIPTFNTQSTSLAEVVAPSTLSFPEHSIRKPQILSKDHAQRLKTKIQLAHYKCRTNQHEKPILQIIRNHPIAFDLAFEELDKLSLEKAKMIKKRKASKQTLKQQVRTLVAPSTSASASLSAGHYSLLAESTPLKSKSPDLSSNNKQKTAFTKTNSSSTKYPSISLQPIPESKADTPLNHSAIVFRSVASPTKYSVKLEDLVNPLNITPVKSRLDGSNGQCSSSPTRTPRRTAAAESLLVFSRLESSV